MSAQAAASLKSRTFPSAASLSCRQHTLQAQHHTSPGGHTAMWPEERTPSSLSQGRVSPCHDIPGKARCLHQWAGPLGLHVRPVQLSPGIPGSHTLQPLPAPSPLLSCSVLSGLSVCLSVPCLMPALTALRAAPAQSVLLPCPSLLSPPCAASLCLSPSLPSGLAGPKQLLTVLPERLTV